MVMPSKQRQKPARGVIFLTGLGIVLLVLTFQQTQLSVGSNTLLDYSQLLLPSTFSTAQQHQTLKPSSSTSDEATSKRRMQQTEAGVDLTDPALYETVDLRGDSSTATVMGMASGYGLNTYQAFVGSLRKSGFKGNIILGVAPNIPKKALRYFEYRNVTPKILKFVNCTNPFYKNGEEKTNPHKREVNTCVHPYPDIKIRWSRFPLQRDWLAECDTCTGPVLTMDVRDSFFQQDPFGPGPLSAITGLQIFQEHPNMTTDNWLTTRPIFQCKGYRIFNKPMICSGTTIGTRAAMLKYFEVMHAEMKVWASQKKCQFGMNGDDQSMHNHLWYTGQLPFAQSIPNRVGIVNTVGWEGGQYKDRWVKQGLAEGLTRDEAVRRQFPGANNRTWIGVKEYNLTDEDGYFTQYDGTRSRVVHQVDRLGRTFTLGWFPKQSFGRDPLPPPMVRLE